MTATMFDTYKAVKSLEAAGASEELARAVVRIIDASATKDPIQRNEALDRAQIRPALSTVELRITKRFAWISLGVLGGSIFCSVVMSISLLSG